MSNVLPDLREKPGLYEPPQRESGSYSPEVQERLQKWNKRRKQALSDRRNYEPTWHVCRSFLAGRQWVRWGGDSRSGRVIEEPNPQKRERHTVNVLAQYVTTIMGKLFAEDLRPPVLFTRDDHESESIASHTQALSKFLWDNEVDGETRVFQLLMKELTYGTGALRCMLDPSRGDVIAEVPIGPDKNPIVDPALAREYVLAAYGRGEQVELTTLREGKIVWEDLSPFNILPPPGVEDDSFFPWLIIERPMPIEWARGRWPKEAERLREQDMSTVDTMGVRNEGRMDAWESPSSPTRKLEGHTLVSTGYELPCPDYPNGLTIEWNSENNLLLDVREQLPYRLNGLPHHGIVFFHYRRVPGRFWSVGAVEDLIGPQRQRNRARSQMIELKDRNLGRVYARKGTLTAQNAPVGKIMEVIEVPLHADYPQETAGGGIGPWVENEARLNDEDMRAVSGLGEVSLGQTPTGVSAFAALSLMAEQDERRVGPALKMLRRGLSKTMVISLELARMYWPEGRQFSLAGPEGMIETYNFSRASLPLDFYVDVSDHAPLPTSPAVEAQKIFDIFNAATSAGQPLPVDWLKASLDQGRALPIPKREEQVQIAKAEQENMMLMSGMMVQPAYFDDDFIHISIHRQLQAELSGMLGVNMQAAGAGGAQGGAQGQPQMSPEQQQAGAQLQMIEMHIQMHAQNAAMKKPMGAQGAQNPNAQGPRGIEAQNSPQLNQQAGAQQQAMG